MLSDISINIIYLSIIDAKCQQSFAKYPDSKCILYADKDCNDALGLKKMLKDERLTTLESGVLSVSIRNGCKLTIYGGNFVMSVYLMIVDVKVENHINSSTFVAITSYFRKGNEQN